MSVMTAGTESPKNHVEYHIKTVLTSAADICLALLSGNVSKDMTNRKSLTELLILMTLLALLVLDKNTVAERTLCSLPR